MSPTWKVPCRNIAQGQGTFYQKTNARSSLLIATSCVRQRSRESMSAARTKNLKSFSTTGHFSVSTASDISFQCPGKINAHLFAPPSASPSRNHSEIGTSTPPSSLDIVNSVIYIRSSKHLHCHPTCAKQRSSNAVPRIVIPIAALIARPHDFANGRPPPPPPPCVVHVGKIIAWTYSHVISKAARHRGPSSAVHRTPVSLHGPSSQLQACFGGGTASVTAGDSSVRHDHSSFPPVP